MDDEWNQLYGIKKKDLNAADLCQALLGIVMELSKILVSSLLVIFVPQDCNGSTCTIKQNFEDLTAINRAAIIFNFITLGFLMLMYFIIYRREKYIIYHFDESGKLPKTNCIVIFAQHPEIESGICWYNKVMFWCAAIAGVIYVLNMIISGVVIFRDYYDGYQSVVQYLVNAGLCTYLIYRSIVHSRSSLVLSNTSFLPVAYNDVDQDYARRKSIVVGIDTFV